MKALIDTNVLIYDTFEDSIFHRDARKLLDSLNIWYLPLIVLYEYVWFMKGLGVSAKDVYDKVLEYIESERTRVVAETGKIVLSALTSILDENISLSRFNDKILVQIALEGKIPIASYDRKLRSQARKHGLTILPPRIPKIS